MREQPIGIVSFLELVQPRQLPFCVPAQWPLVAMSIVHIDLDVRGVCTTRRDKDTSCGVADLGRNVSSRAVREADIEEAKERRLTICRSQATEQEFDIQACDSTSIRIGG